MKKASINIYFDNAEFADQIQYSFEMLFNPLKGSDINLKFNERDACDGISIEYRSDKKIEGSLHIKPQSIIFSKSKNIDSLLPNKYIYKDYFLYSVELVAAADRPFDQDGLLNFDIVEATFFHLSRLEEISAGAQMLDKHGRMRSENQFLVHNKLHRIPVVDHIRAAVLDVLSLGHINQKTKYSLTHDIDCTKRFGSANRTVRAFARAALKERSMGRVFSLAAQYWKKIRTKVDPYDTFDWLFSENKSERKVVFFMSGGKTSYDNLYSISDQFSRDVISNALKNNYEIGLHPSYITFESIADTSHERDVLSGIANKDIRSSRQHILRFNPGVTPHILQNSGMQYDYSMGYSDRVGFRCGTGLPFILFDWKVGKKGNVIEIPLVVMDGPLLMENNYDIEKSTSDLSAFINENKRDTMITFNFHNSIFADTKVDFNKMKSMYIHLNKMISPALV